MWVYIFWGFINLPEFIIILEIKFINIDILLLHRI